MFRQLMRGSVDLRGPTPRPPTHYPAWEGGQGRDKPMVLILNNEFVDDIEMVDASVTSQSRAGAVNDIGSCRADLALLLCDRCIDSTLVQLNAKRLELEIKKKLNNLIVEFATLSCLEAPAFGSFVSDLDVRKFDFILDPLKEFQNLEWQKYDNSADIIIALSDRNLVHAPVAVRPRNLRLAVCPSRRGRARGAVRGGGTGIRRRAGGVGGSPRRRAR
ncbi:hypothetical protein EVAR_78513_1 [Eumeta japonica]|uniref:Uncharacterized protein n=1 Tax=Eumeta variegata TaxID=151549 RepID=A0A4C1TY95_EUMVA|nr:hypothetical protein EVAR_78513_1 [Eumeta japonica]